MKMNIRSKIVACISMGILAVAAGAILLARQAVSKGFTNERLKMGSTVTQYLAEKMVTPLLTNDLPRINLIIYRVTQENENIAYIFLTDRKGQVMASTLGDDLTNKIAGLNPIYPGRAYSIRSFYSKETGIYDVASQVLKSEIGGLHIGFSDQDLQTSLDDFNKTFSLIIFLICLASLGVAVYIARHIIDPLENLAGKMRQVRQGDLDVRLDKLPNDEIGLLGQTFNQMIGDLKGKSQKLKLANKELHTNNYYLEYTVREVQHLLESAIEQKSFKVRFHNPDLQKCWEVKQCKNLQCPAYENLEQRCWQVAGTFCKGKVQGKFTQKLKDCQKCEVYQKAISSKLSIIGEVFNNMMGLLGENQQQLQDYAQNLEGKVEKRTADLKQANQELKDAQSQLVQTAKLAAIGQLAAGVSHELNNPLGGILGYSQFILDKARRKGGPENLASKDLASIFTYVGYIEKESQRCKIIVANLLKFSRASKSEFDPLDINQALEETFTLARHQLEMNQVKLIQELAPGLPRIMGNQHQLQQVFTNLLLNAQQAVKGGGTLTVSSSLRKSPDAKPVVELSFADNGCGIPRENMGRLFDPFFTTKQAGEGTGLGLSVSYGIIKAHGGEIEVESEPRKGAVFRIKLPV